MTASDSRTRRPRAAEKATAVNPSRTLLTASSAASPVSPLRIAPRNVSGPTQNTMLAVTNASAIVLAPPGREATLHDRAEVVEPALDAGERADRAADEDRAQQVEEVRGVDRELRAPR